MKRIILLLAIFPTIISAYSQRCVSGNCVNGYGTYEWTNEYGFVEEYYVGDWKNGKMNGKGTYYFANDDIYIGEWKNGYQDGMGT